MTVSNSFNRAGTASTGYLFMLLGSSFILALVAGLMITPIMKFLGLSELNTLLITNALLLIVMFYLSSYITEFYHRKRYDTYLFRLNWDDCVERPIVWAFAFYMFSLPLTISTAYLMELIPIPKYLDFLSESTAEYQHMLDLISASDSFWEITVTIISLAVVPAIVEEVFFRGAILSWLLAKSRRVHLSVWLVAIIFSLAHFEWTGLISRTLLGAILGYIAVYGGIYTAILFHGLNNFVAVLGYLTIGSEIGESGPVWFYILMGILSVIALYLMVKSFQAMERSRIRKQSKIESYESI